jgi:hypothetical protein
MLQKYRNLNKEPRRKMKEDVERKRKFPNPQSSKNKFLSL